MRNKGLALVLFAALASTEPGCRSWFFNERGQCQHNETRCSPDGVPQVCAAGAWAAAPTAEPCSASSRVCCFTSSYVDDARPIHTCVSEPRVCLPDATAHTDASVTQ